MEIEERKIVTVLGLLACLGTLGSCDRPQQDNTPAPARQAVDFQTERQLPKDSPGSTRVVLLGTGTPTPDPRSSGPATAIVVGNRGYLVDLGAGVIRRAQQAYQAGVSALDTRFLTHAFVTHLHSDHTIGYPDLILTPATVGRRSPVHVFGPAGLKKMTDNILAAYQEDLNVRAKSSLVKDMSGYRVIVHEIEPGKVFEDKRVSVSAFAVEHGSWERAFGFRFDTQDRSIVISGDTGPTKAVVEACAGCDVLIHEVYCTAGFERGSEDWQKYHAAFHTSSVQLAELASLARPKLLILYHKLFFGCTEEQLLREVSTRYKGNVVLGRDLEVY